MNAEEYLTAHSLSADFVSTKLGWAWDTDKITIPIYNAKGTLLFCRYRNFAGDAKFTADRGSHPALYAVHMIAKKDTVVLCEGEPDCARLWQEGIAAVTGTSGVRTFSTALALPLAGKRVIVCLDSDEAGKSAVAKYCESLTAAGANVFIMDLPVEYKDVCEYFAAGHTKKEFFALPTLAIDDWQEAHEDPKFSIIEGTELLGREIPSEEWLVDRVLPQEGFAFIVGPEASGKSFYTLTLAHAVTTGEAWLDKFSVPATTNVLFIDKENTKRRTQTRMRGLGMTGKGMYWLEYPHFFEMSDEKEEDGFSQIIKAAAAKVRKYGIGLIIVDSFADVMIGNENAAGDVQRFFDGMRQQFSGTSILVLHHASKPTQGVPRTSAQRARGSTNIMAQIYSGFYSEAHPKNKNEFTLEQTKAGDAEKLTKFKVDMKVLPDANAPGKTIVASLKWAGEVEDEEEKVDVANMIIRDILEKKSVIGSREILDLCIAEGVSERTFRRAIKDMKMDGEIIVTGFGKQTKYMVKEGVQEAEEAIDELEKEQKSGGAY